jgi:hypothetical protein
MARRKVKLTDDQKRRNEEILERLDAERRRLVEETRALQEQTKRKPGRKKKTQPLPPLEE